MKRPSLSCMKLFVASLLLMATLFVSAAAAQDPFSPFLDKAAVPKETLSETTSGSGATGAEAMRKPWRARKPSTGCETNPW